MCFLHIRCYMFTFASCIWVQPWFVWHSFLMSLCYHQLLARLIAFLFVAMCFWYFLLSTIPLFLSIVCVVHMYHLMFTTLSIGHYSKDAPPFSCRSLNEFAVSTKENNWLKRWVFSSDTLLLGFWRIGWWCVVVRFSSLVDDFCTKKRHQIIPDEIIHSGWFSGAKGDSWFVKVDRSVYINPRTCFFWKIWIG